MRTEQKGLLGRKIGMTRIFDDGGNAVGVTVVQAGPCTIVQKKSTETDGYTALQLAFDPVEEKKVTKPLKGHFSKSGKGCFRLLKEIRIPEESAAEYEIGQELTVELFEQGESINVTGISKGKGFSGVIKRHHFSGFPASHGTHEVKRHGGAIGQASSPSRVFKGLKMAGQLGSSRVTVKNLTVEKVLPDKSVLLIKGAVPGANGNYLLIRNS